MTKEGRGKGARWVLVVTDSYGMAVLPLQVTGALPPIKGGVFIPSEALKAIDKTRAFSLTKKGGIQPVKVTERTGHVHAGARAGVGQLRDVRPGARERLAA
jgi:hypothetical protein